MATHNNLDFASLQVRDLKKSKHFYTKVLGFQPTDESPPGALVFKNDAGAIFAIRTPLQPLSTDDNLGRGVSLWFDVSDVDEIYKHVTESDGTVIAPPQPGPFGKQITIADVDGYMLVFHEYTK